eukprot:g65436.t1
MARPDPTVTRPSVSHPQRGSSPYTGETSAICRFRRSRLYEKIPKYCCTEEVDPDPIFPLHRSLEKEGMVARSLTVCERREEGCTSCLNWDLTTLAPDWKPPPSHSYQGRPRSRDAWLKAKKNMRVHLVSMIENVNLESIATHVHGFRDDNGQLYPLLGNRPWAIQCFEHTEFALMAIAMLTFWRGTWVLMDEILFPKRPKVSCVVCLSVGSAIWLIFKFMIMCFRKWLRSRDPDSWMVRVVSHRLIIYMLSIATVMLCRGCWVFQNIYIIPHRQWLSALVSHLIGVLFSWTVCSTKYNVAAPFVTLGPAFRADIGRPEGLATAEVTQDQA